MADPPRYPDSNDDLRDNTGVGPARGSPTGTPRWVKVFGIIAIVVAVLFVILLFTSGHGPGRHMSFNGGSGVHPRAFGATFSGDNGGHTPPTGGRTSRWP